MRNISIGQVIILLIICFLLFGDFSNVRKKIKLIINKITQFINDKNLNNRKKGT